MEINPERAWTFKRLGFINQTQQKGLQEMEMRLREMYTSPHLPKMLNLVTCKLTRDSECRRVLVIVYRPVRDIFISYGKDLSECTARRIFGLEFRV